MIYASEGALSDGRPVHRAIVQQLRRSGARGATAIRGVWGFAGSRRPQGDRLFQLGRRVPVLTIVIDSPERIPASFSIIDDLTREHGVVTSEMVPALTTMTGTTRHGGLRLARHRY
jgi:PII-like signaling protein